MSEHASLGAAGFGTPFCETEALLYASEDVEADSGNHEPLDTYLREQFAEFELRKLENTADQLSYRAGVVRRQMREEHDRADREAEGIEP